MSLSVGSTPSLAEKPLTRWFSHTEAGARSGLTLVSATASALAEQLAAGSIAAALLPSFECFRLPGYSVVPGISLSGQSEIESVRAYARVPWRRIESILLDQSEHTSAALLKILLAEQLDAYPAFLNAGPNAEALPVWADACLLTGDAALRAEGAGLNMLDLGRAWRRLTGLPFVYAVWVGRPEALTPDIVSALSAAKAWGLTQRDVIAAEEAAGSGLTVPLCRRYLTDVVDYDLGEEHLLALETFGTKAIAQQLLRGPLPPVHVV